MMMRIGTERGKVIVTIMASAAVVSYLELHSPFDFRKELGKQSNSSAKETYGRKDFTNQLSYLLSGCGVGNEGKVLV